MDKRKELISAAMAGIRGFLMSTRGADMFGSEAKVIVDHDGEGFTVVHRNGQIVYFDVVEI